MFGISNLSTEKTYFDRFKNNWDFLVTTEADSYSKALLNDIRNIEGVENQMEKEREKNEEEDIEKNIELGYIIQIQVL